MLPICELHRDDRTVKERGDRGKGRQTCTQESVHKHSTVRRGTTLQLAFCGACNIFLLLPPNLPNTRKATCAMLSSELCSVCHSDYGGREREGRGGDGKERERGRGDWREREGRRWEGEGGERERGRGVGGRGRGEGDGREREGRQREGRGRWETGGSEQGEGGKSGQGGRGEESE